MRTKQIAVIMVLSLLTVLAWGQTNTNSIPLPGSDAPASISLTGWLLVLIPLLAPMGVATFKYFIPKIPKFLLPVLAPILGILIDQLASLAPGQESSPLYAAILGASGVMVREAYDQVKKLIPDQNA